MILNNLKKGKNKGDIPTDILIQCPDCFSMIFKNDLVKSQKVCQICGCYLKMSGRERLDAVLDKNTFVEYFRDRHIRDPLKFPKYKDKQTALRKSLNQDEAVVCGIGKIKGLKVAIAVMDTNFMMGSMGSSVGEKITKTVELAIKKKLPLIIFTASGGARMQEGMFSLMQMAKTSQAIGKLSEKGILYIAVMTDPTTGGVSASFASLGDIIIAEKNALIGFAGQRVIEQTTGAKLPEGFQRAEFLLEHGLVDMVVERSYVRDTLGHILEIHTNGRKVKS